MTHTPLSTPERGNFPGIASDAGEAPTMTVRDRIETALLELGDVHRLWILEAARDQPVSPKTVAEQHLAPLGTVAYHTRTLLKAGLLRVHREERVRGAIQTFYVLTAAGRRLHAKLLEAPDA